MALNQDLTTLAELWDEPLGLDPAPVEAERLYLKMKKMMYSLEVLVLQLDTLDTSDRAGREQARSIFEMYERATDRLMAFTQFALKYNLAERRTEILESQAQDIARAVLTVVLDPQLQLTEAQIAMIRVNLSREMIKLSPKLRPPWDADFSTEDNDAEVTDDEN